jgi:hypothetical protein
MRRPVFSVLGNANHDILEKANVDPHEPKRVEGLDYFIVTERTWWKETICCCWKDLEGKIIVSVGRTLGGKIIVSVGEDFGGKIIVSVGKALCEERPFVAVGWLWKTGWSGK